MKHKILTRYFITAMTAAVVILLFAGCQAEAPASSETSFTHSGVLTQIYAAEFEGQEGISRSWISDAKGNEQLVLRESTDDQGRQVRLMLVYDRKSQNDACDLAVLEQVTYEQKGQEYSAVDTSILDMYAVVRKTGEVIASGKTDWGDIGSKEYQAATGE
ncbi:hypothetical protein [Eubacterium sp. 1001713B170207_170306_E7]|uniref:hypothetical protein n=1 Tax=Eubacterium sp. 1001713B170207_170306_E7 TaxID=2787097 RepID=UPI001898CA4D|nr:hypothetical protein [Eubacterium sp. 1001713B170207_170306_E7]